MTIITTVAKGAAIAAAIVASPAVVILAIPFGCGVTGDFLEFAGTPGALALTASTCLAALLWTRYRVRLVHAEAPPRRVPKTVG